MVEQFYIGFQQPLSNIRDTLEIQHTISLVHLIKKQKNTWFLFIGPIMCTMDTVSMICVEFQIVTAIFLGIMYNYVSNLSIRFTVYIGSSDPVWPLGSLRQMGSCQCLKCTIGQPNYYIYGKLLAIGFSGPSQMNTMGPISPVGMSIV